MLGLSFVAVMPRSTSPEKIALIEFHGGRCHFVRQRRRHLRRGPPARRGVRRALPRPVHPRRARDRLAGNNNIAESIFEPARRRAAPGPGVGRRRCRHRRYERDHRPVPALPPAPTRLAVVDPENSSFFPGYATATRRRRPGGPPGSRASAARGWSRRSCRPSSTGCSTSPTPPRWPRCATSTEVPAGGPAGRPAPTCGAPSLVAEMLAAGRTGSVVTLLCDGGERYAHTYYSDEWVAGAGPGSAPHAATLRRFAARGEWAPPAEQRDGLTGPSVRGRLRASNLQGRSRRALCPRPDPSGGRSAR